MEHVYKYLPKKVREKTVNHFVQNTGLAKSLVQTAIEKAFNTSDTDGNHLKLKSIMSFLGMESIAEQQHGGSLRDAYLNHPLYMQNGVNTSNIDRILSIHQQSKSEYTTAIIAAIFTVNQTTTFAHYQ